MAYTQQIKLLEQKLEQLNRFKHEGENFQKVLTIQSEIKKLKRLEWEETHERLVLENDR